MAYGKAGDWYVNNVEGGGSSWQTVFEGSVTTEASDFGAFGEIQYESLIDADKIKVTFNGTEYECPKMSAPAGGNAYGGIGESGPDFSEYPFAILSAENLVILSAENQGTVSTTIYTQTADTYTLKIEEEQSGGSSDFSTAEVSINIIGGSRTNKVEFDGAAFLAVGPDGNAFITSDPSLYSPATIPFVLYQGQSSATLIPPENFSITNVSTEGDVSVNDNVYVDIHGNGSITITITAD